MKDAPVDSLDMLFKPDVVQAVRRLRRDVPRFARGGSAAGPRLPAPGSEHLAQRGLRGGRGAGAQGPPVHQEFRLGRVPQLARERRDLRCDGLVSDYAIAVDRARAAGIDLPVAFTIPKEGTSNTVNGWLIPFDAPDVAEAHEFINYMLRPDVIAKVTNDTHYPNEIPGSRPFLNPES